jgi:hypothetical protein
LLVSERKIAFCSTPDPVASASGTDATLSPADASCAKAVYEVKIAKQSSIIPVTKSLFFKAFLLSPKKGPAKL